MSLLTTVIPVYNGEKFLPATLESVAAQTRRPDRVIVLDDESTDDTAQIAKEFSGIEVEHVLNPQNLGLFENHNRALDFSTETDYLHILHANDLIRPEFYEAVLNCFDEGDEPAMGFSQYEFIDEEGNVTGAPSQPNFEQPREISKKEFLIRQSELRATLIDATLHRTSRQPALFRFPLDYPHVADVMFHAGWADKGARLFETPKALCQFRKHEGSMTNANTKKLQAWVVDEWRAIDGVSKMIQEGGLSRALRGAKLRCLFAARTMVKVKMFRNNPEYARQIATEGRRQVGGFYWLLGRIAVGLRDAIKPRTDLYGD
jgi:glycosyltransferase involved in cell wall biosynthesis